MATGLFGGAIGGRRWQWLVVAVGLGGRWWLMMLLSGWWWCLWMEERMK